MATYPLIKRYSAYWQEQADHCRHLAELMLSCDAKECLLKCAEEWDEIALRSENPNINQILITPR